MPYTLTETDDPNAIAECQYGQASAVMFTKFTSCIGILAKVTGAQEVIGIHLVMVDAEGNTFGEADVPQVINVLSGRNYDPADVLIIGQISAWERSAAAAYQKLIETLPPRDKFPLGDGVYGGEIRADGRIFPTVPDCEDEEEN